MSFTKRMLTGTVYNDDTDGDIQNKLQVPGDDMEGTILPVIVNGDIPYYNVVAGNINVTIQLIN